MEANASAVLSDGRLLARILRSLVQMGDSPAWKHLCACAPVSRAFAAATINEELWREALLRRWPGMLACVAPAALPTGVRLRELYKRRHKADADATPSPTSDTEPAQFLDRRRVTPAVPLEHRYRFELELFKPDGCTLVFSASFSLRFRSVDVDTTSVCQRLNDSEAAADYDRIITATRATYSSAERISHKSLSESESESESVEKDYQTKSTSFDLDLTTHVSHPLASVEELRSLLTSLTVFRRCPAMSTGDMMNDFAVLYANHRLVLLENITRPPAQARWDVSLHTLGDGVLRIMAAGELPYEDAGFEMEDPGGRHHGLDGHWYNVTIQVCLDAHTEESGGIAIPAVQPRARMVFTSMGMDYGPIPSRANIEEILGPLVAWSSEHHVDAADDARGWFER